MAVKYKRTKVEKVKVVKEPPRNQDALGAYPTTVHVSAQPERRYLKTTRVLAIVAIVNMCLMAILTLTVFMFSPRIRSHPKFFTLDYRFQRFSELERYEITKTSNDLLSEKYVADYVIARHTIYPSEDRMNMHWTSPTSLIVLYSDPHILGQVEAEKDYIRRRIQKDGLSRTVEIKWIQRMKASWAVEFETRDKVMSKDTVGKRRWRAYLRAVYDPEKIYPDKARKFLNPYGFTVMEYYLASVSSRQAIESDERQRKNEEEQKITEKILKEENLPDEIK